MTLALALLLAIARADAPPSAPDVPVEAAAVDVAVRAWLDGGVDARGANLLVQIESPADVTPELALPEIPDVTLTLSATPGTETVNGRRITTFRLRADAPKGRHAIGPFVASGSAGGAPFRAVSTVVFVDLGVEALDLGDLADIAEPAPVWTFPVAAAVTIGAVLALVAAGLTYGFRRAPAAALAEVEAEPPDIVALRAWKAVRHDPTLDDHQKALALSQIFREYAEAALHFPAAKWTTTETLAHLGGLPHLEEGNLPRARRLLRATDRVKYADEAPGVDLFEELDADLRAFVTSTRPMRWAAT